MIPPRSLLALFLSLAGLCGQVATANAQHPWPMFGKDRRHQGRHGGIFSLASNKRSLAVVGRYGQGGVVVGHDASGAEVIYGASRDSSFGEKVWAVKGSDGSFAWSVPYEANTEASVDVTPYLSNDDVLYLAAQDNTVAAFSATSGAELWKTDVSSALTGDGSFFRSSPIADASGTLHMLTDPFLGGGSADLVAISATGSVSWVEGLGPGSSGDGAVAILDDQSLVMVTMAALSVGYGGRVAHLHGTTHQPIWDYRHPAPFPFLGTPAVDDDGSIYFGARAQAAGYFFLMALDQSGNEKWRNTTISSRGSAAIGPTWVYFIDEANDLLALDKATGAVKWRVPMGRGSDANRAPPVVDACGTVVAASTAGNIKAVSAAGHVLWEETFDGQPLGSLAVGAQGTIYVRAYGLFAFGGAAASTCPDGNPPPDAGVLIPDAGTVTPDASVTADQGTSADLGGAHDGGAPQDASPTDLAAPKTDAGEETESNGCDCRAGTGAQGGTILLLAAFVVLGLRRRRHE